MPISTIHDKMKKYQKDIIKKHTIILNSSHLGYNIKTHSMIKVDNGDKETISGFLNKHNNVNNVYKINNGYDYILEAYFRDMNDSEKFFEEIELKFKIKKRETYYILDEIKREGFLTNDLLVNVLP